MSYWDEVEPWAAPSLAFAVWALVMTWLVGRWRRWALGRLDAVHVAAEVGEVIIPNPIRTLEALPGATFAVAREAKS